MSQSSSSGTPLPAPAGTDSGRSRMSIPNLVHGVTTAADADMDEKSAESRYRYGRGREEGGSSGVFQSPTEAFSFSSKQTPPSLPPAPRFHCNYVHPCTGRRCTSWPQGFSSPSDLSRHHKNIHGKEEIRLIRNSELSLEHAQIVTSSEEYQRLETHFSSNAHCESCGLVFTSGRRDAISRHVRKGACSKRMESLRNSPP